MTFIAKAPKIDVRRLRKKKSYEAEEVLRRLNAFLDKNFEEPMKILRHFWKDQQDAMTYAELREAIKTGHLSDYTARAWRYDYAKLVNDHLSHTWRNALALGPSGQPSMDNLTSFRLDMQKPGVLNWIGARGAEFVTNEVQEQKDAIRSVLMRGVTNQHTVDEMARVIRPLVGLNKPQTIANYNYYNHMVKTLTEQHPRTSAASIQARAQEAAWKYAEKQHRERAYMIARTEMSFAYNRGAYEGIKQAQELGLMGAVVKIWSTSQGGNVCPDCEALEGEEVGMEDTWGDKFPSRGLFRGDNLVPPLHPRCECAIVYQEVSTKDVGGLKPAYSYDEYDLPEEGFSFDNNVSGASTTVNDNTKLIDEQIELLSRYGNLDTLLLTGSREELNRWQELREATGLDGKQIIEILIQNANKDAEAWEKLFFTQTDKQMEAFTKQLLDTATKEELEALRLWSGPRYSDICRYLRFGHRVDDEAIEAAKNIEAVLSRMGTQQELILRRGTGTKSIFKDMPKGWKDDPSLLVGQTFPDKSFTATTPLESGGFSGTGKDRATLYIHAPKGTHGAYIASIAKNEKEKEFLLQKDYNYRIIKAEYRPNIDDPNIKDLFVWAEVF